MRHLDNAIGLTRKDVDVRDFEKVREVMKKHQPDVVINTTAYHDLVECEKNPSESFLVNCFVVKNMAEICKELGIDFITISTDYVFGLDARRKEPYIEEDSPGPLSTYAISKLAGEYAALSSWEKTIILRTCGLYGLEGSKTRGGNFVDKRIANAKETDSLEMSSEQTMTPTYTEDLAEVIKKLIEMPNKKYGIYNATNEGRCSWHEFTEEIYKIMGLKTKVIPSDRGGVFLGVKKPLFSVLENKKLKNLGVEMPHWRDALRRYIEEKYGKGS